MANSEHFKMIALYTVIVRKISNVNVIYLNFSNFLNVQTWVFAYLTVKLFIFLQTLII